MTPDPIASTAPRRGLSQPAYAMGGDLLLGLDPLCLLAATWLTTWAVLHARGWSALPAGLSADALLWGWMAALLAPFVLFDRRFGPRASRGRTGPLLRTHLLRLALLGTLLLGLSHLGDQPTRLPADWLGLWLALAAIATLLTRLGLARIAQGLLRQGRLSETVAVVGSGPTARRLLRQLQGSSTGSVEVVGVFDDRRAARAPTDRQPRGSPPDPLEGTERLNDGTVDALLALAQQRHIDWIVLTLPPGDGRRVRALVQRLKALSVPIALCPQQLGLAMAMAPTASVGLTVPVTLLGHGDGWHDAAAHPGGSPVVPRWVGTLAQLMLAGAQLLAAELRHRLRRPVPRQPLPPTPPTEPSPPTLRFDDHDLASFTALARQHDPQRFSCVVMPGTDQLIRLNDDPSFRTLCASAEHVLLGSRAVAHLLRRLREVRVGVCPGSELTARLFERVIGADDALVLIGASAAQAEQLRVRHGLRRLAHHAPPTGFIGDTAAVETCLSFIEAHSPFRFCLLALGSPQQELIAQRLRERGRARGLALCVGTTAVDRLTDADRHAPLGSQLARLVRGLRVVGVLREAAIAVRPPRETRQPVHAPAAPPGRLKDHPGPRPPERQRPEGSSISPGRWAGPAFRAGSGTFRVSAFRESARHPSLHREGSRRDGGVTGVDHLPRVNGRGRELKLRLNPQAAPAARGRMFRVAQPRWLSRRASRAALRRAAARRPGCPRAGGAWSGPCRRSR